MTKNKHRRKRPEQPLDLALVIGLAEMIRRLARYTSLGLKFADLSIIEWYEKGGRRLAIRHIRETMTPRSLGLRVHDPRPKGPHPGVELGKMLRAGRPCPRCHEGELYDKKLEDKTLTVCSNERCDLELEHITLKNDPKRSGDVAKFLTDMRNHQILSHWHGLNDPDPPRYAAARRFPRAA